MLNRKEIKNLRSSKKTTKVILLTDVDTKSVSGGRISAGSTGWGSGANLSGGGITGPIRMR